MSRIKSKSVLVTVNFPNVTFTAFSPVTTLGNTLFNFQKPVRLKRVYPIASPDMAINARGRIRFLDVNGNPLQVTPVTGVNSAGAIPSLRIDSRVGYSEFTGLEIGGFTVTNIAVEVSATLSFNLTFEFEEEYLDNSF